MVTNNDISDNKSLQKILDRANRSLAYLEEQAAGYTALTIPTHLAIEIDEKRSEIEDIKKRLNLISKGALENRKRLIEKIETFWIRQVFRGSLHKEKTIEVTVEHIPEMIENPWNNILQRNSYTSNSRSLSAKTTLQEILHSEITGLLILGKPGAGKTIALLDICQNLIVHAKDNPDTPIPVVFNLASWSSKYSFLESWIIDELFDKYQVPHTIGAEWVKNDSLTLLLDGLDETTNNDRNHCVNAINEFRQKHNNVKLVVCSRIDEYKHGQLLRLEQSVCLQPLTQEQISLYLETAGFDDLDKGVLAQNDDLWRLLSSPLMLNIFVITYPEIIRNSLPDHNSHDAWKNYLLAQYAEYMFDRRGNSTKNSKENSSRWLSWLANRLNEENQTIFLIEKINGDWLRNSRLNRLYETIVTMIITIGFILFFGSAVGICTGMIFGKQFGVIAGLVFGIAWGIPGLMWCRNSYTAFNSLLSGLGFAFAWGVVGWLAFQIIGAIIFSFLGGVFGYLGYGVGLKRMQPVIGFTYINQVKPVEILRWSWRKAVKTLKNWFLISLPVGIAVGAPIGIIFSLPLGIAYGSVSTLSFLATFGIGGGITSGEIETKIKPNQGIRRSLRNSLALGAAFFLVIFIIFNAFFGIILDVNSGLLSGLFVGLAGGYIGFLPFGGLAVLKHLVLRIIMWQNRFAPLNYHEFLEYSVERIFMYKVGGGYIYIHRLLQDHFASLYPLYFPED